MPTASGRRGRCARCGSNRALRKDGCTPQHYPFSGGDDLTDEELAERHTKWQYLPGLAPPLRCPGGGRPPRRAGTWEGHFTHGFLLDAPPSPGPVSGAVELAMKELGEEVGAKQSDEWTFTLRFDPKTQTHQFRAEVDEHGSR